MMKKISLPLAGIALLLGGCTTYIPTAGVPAVLPALTATPPGDALSYDDLQILNGVAQRNLEERASGREDFWRNIQTRHHGAVVSYGVVYAADGTPCRDMEQSAVVRGRMARARGRACRAPNGIWGVVQSHSLPSIPAGGGFPPPGAGNYPPPAAGNQPQPVPPAAPVFQPGKPGGWQTLGDSLAPGGAKREGGWQNESF